MDFDKAACINRSCEQCKGLSLLEICDEELSVERPVSFMLRTSVEYTTNKGVKKMRYDFVPKVLPIKCFLTHFEARLAEIAPHHADMSWQSKDWKHVQKTFPLGSWLCVQDFSENLTIEVKLEHQSKYYSSITITLFGMVASFWIDDIKDSYLSNVKKNRLKTELTKVGKPHQLHITFAFISNDHRHNQAFVQHVNALALQYVCKYIMKKPPNATYARSDGAPTQFQNATQHFWIGLHRHVTKTTRMDWCLHCSCHGKDRVDPEMGTLKNMIRRYLLKENVDNADVVRIHDYEGCRFRSLPIFLLSFICVSSPASFLAIMDLAHSLVPFSMIV